MHVKANGDKLANKVEGPTAEVWVEVGLCLFLVLCLC